MEIQKIRLSKEEFDHGRIAYASNLVMVEVDKGELRSAGGVVLGFSDDIQYAEGKDNHIANVAKTHGRIVKLPANLCFEENNPNRSAWRTQIEVEIGDEVWYSPLSATNCAEVFVEDKVYKMIRYGDLFVAKRKGKVICLNGYCVVEKVYKKSLGSLDSTSEQELDTTRGIVRFAGRPNPEYFNPKYTDDIDINVGDEVLFTKDNYPIPLEIFKYNSTFDNSGKQYWVCQRRFMAYVLSENN